MNTEIDDEKEATMVESIVELLPAAPLRLEDLANEWGTTVDDVVFKRAVWQSMNVYLQETGVRLRESKGEIVALTPAEQAEYAKRSFVKSATKLRRSYETASGAARRDPTLALKVERIFAREASRAAPQSSGELAARQRAERDALIAGGTAASTTLLRDPRTTA